MRVTEAAALAAGRWIGHGDKIAADGAAVDAMRLMIDTVSMHGTVVIGEGEKDEAPMLYNGEEVGDGTGPGVDVAVDPIDGTRLTALGQPNALAVIALAERGSMFFPGAAVYMEKVATGPEAADAIDITASAGENVRRVAKAKGVRPEEITVTILDRDRHAVVITAVREVGARVFLITRRRRGRRRSPRQPRARASTCSSGIGGTPEGVIAAAALKCLGGAIQDGSGRGTTTSVARSSNEGFDLDTGARHRRRSSRDDEVFFAATGRHRRLAAARGEVLARRRDDAFDGDAFAVGNGSLGRGPAPIRETRAILGDPVPPLTLPSHRMHHEVLTSDILRRRTRYPREWEMAEKTILVCDACGKPAVETVTIKAARGNFVKDLCATHVNELVSGARAPSARTPEDRRRPPRRLEARGEEDRGAQDDGDEASRPSAEEARRLRRRPSQPAPPAVGTRRSPRAPAHPRGRRRATPPTASSAHR